jgi:hypothetical protein
METVEIRFNSLKSSPEWKLVYNKMVHEYYLELGVSARPSEHCKAILSSYTVHLKILLEDFHF